MKPPRLESSIEKSICEYAKRKGCLAIKQGGTGNRGVPDRLFLFGGRCLWVELKRPGGVCTPLQLQKQADLTGRGFTVLVVDDVDQGKMVIDQFVAGVDPSQWEKVTRH